MKNLSAFSQNSKRTYLGLKLYLVTDLNRNILIFQFTLVNTNNRKLIPDLCSNIYDIIIADAGYISNKLAKELFKEGK